jgi:hypothetical protein
MNKPRIAGKTVYIATILAIVTFGAGFALAAVTVTNSTLNGGGNYVNNSPITWWTTSTSPAAVAAVPSPVPTVASTTVGTPTVLAATGQNYEVGSGTAGDIAQIFRMTEATSAVANTEIEIVFTLSTGAGTTTTTVYIETQTSIPGTAQTFSFYMDAGSAASASVTINYAEQVSQQCSAVATCP